MAEKKLDLQNLQVETFVTELSPEELAQIEAHGGATYGPACGATRSYNCYSSCQDYEDDSQVWADPIDP